jgi:hypothetical protein
LAPAIARSGFLVRCRYLAVTVVDQARLLAGRPVHRQGGSRHGARLRV